MSLTKTAEATRAILKLYKEGAYSGELTIDQVVDLVRERVPNAKTAGIYQAIEAYGPIGEKDNAWLRRAEQPQIPGWFYSPSTGKEIE